MLSAIVDILKAEVGELSIIEIDDQASPSAIIIPKEQLLKVAEVLHSNDKLYFDMLSCITGIDNGVEEGTMEVVYNFYSIPFEQSLMVKVVLERTTPEIGSLNGIWKTANWQEREIYDLLGIKFTNHPYQRRILMPTDWEGHPLRKDYENPEKYRGMNVEYDRDEAPSDQLSTDQLKN